MAQVGQGSLDSPVAPGPILGGHAHHQLPDLVAQAAWPTSLAAIILLGEQPAMPGQQRCRSHHGAQLLKRPPAQLLGPHGQASALVVIKMQPLASQLLAQDAVLFLKIVDDVLLLLV
jgi:hypothetical protein